MQTDRQTGLTIVQRATQGESLPHRLVNFVVTKSIKSNRGDGNVSVALPQYVNLFISISFSRFSSYLFRKLYRLFVINGLQIMSHLL